jgi:hypothetical protein
VKIDVAPRLDERDKGEAVAHRSHGGRLDAHGDGRRRRWLARADGRCRFWLSLQSQKRHGGNRHEQRHSYNPVTVFHGKKMEKMDVVDACRDALLLQ